MKTFWLFPAGLVVGAALMWVGLSGRVPADLPVAHAPEPPPVELSGTASREGVAPEAGRDHPRAEPVETPKLRAVDLESEEEDQERVARYHLAMALVSTMEGNLEKALNHMDAALAAGADSDEILAPLEYLESSEQLAVLEAFRARHPELEVGAEWLAMLYQENEQNEKAFDVLLATLRGVEDDDLDTDMMGTLIEINAARAADALRQLSLEKGWDGGILIEIGDYFISNGEGELARSFLIRGLEDNPSSGYGIDLLAQVDPAAAVPMARQAVKDQPENADAWGRLGSTLKQLGEDEESFLAYVKAAQFAEDEDDRRGWLRGLLEADPAAALPLIQRYAAGADDETLGVLGRAYIANEMREEAFATFSEAHRMDPTDSEWLHRLVAADAAGAAALYRAELEREPNTTNDELVGALATALMVQGQPGESFEVFLRAHRMDVDDWEWLRGMARTNPARAVPILEERREIEGEDNSIMGALADAYAQTGRTMEAAVIYDRLIEEGSSEYRWMSSLAVIEPGRGFPMLHAALENNPESDELWGALGDAYRRMGNRGEALRAYERALECDSSDWEWAMRRDQVR